MNISLDDLAKLTGDRDTIQLDDTHELRLRIEPDPESSINDGDCYGRTERYCHDYHERAPRPADMDGSARKIQVSRGEWIWWQPADDLRSLKAWIKSGGDPGTYPEAYAEHLRMAERLLQDGFMQVGLEVWETNERGYEYVIDSTWLGGVDSLDNGYLQDLLKEQIYELAEIPLDIQSVS